MPLDAYIRVSRLGDREEEESTELYESQVRSWADSRGMEIGEVVAEVDVSGSVPVAERGLERLIQRVESGESAGVVTPYLDRFGRDLIEGSIALKRLVDAGGKLIAVRDGFDSMDPGSLLNFNLRMSIAQDFLDRQRAGFQIAADRAVERGVHLGGAVAFGYQKDDERRLVPNEREAAIVRELYTRRAAGETFSALARWAAARCEEEPDTVRNLQRSSVRSILRNRVYLGEVSVKSGTKGKPRVVKSVHPPIVTPAQWEAAQSSLPFNPRTGAAGKVKLRGLVFCHACGKRCKVGAYGSPDNRQSHYACTSEGCPGPRASIKSSILDDFVGGVLEQAAADREPHIAAVLEGDDRYTDAMAAVEEARHDHEEFRDSVELQRQLGIQGFAAGLKVREEALKTARAALSKVRPPERKNAATGTGTPPSTRDEIVSAIDAANLARFVERVVVHPAKRRKWTPPAERVEIYFIGAEDPYVPDLVELPEEVAHSIRKSPVLGPAESGKRQGDARDPRTPTSTPT